MTIGKGKRSAPKRDFMQVARSVVEQAIGEQMDGSALPSPPKDDPKLAGSFNETGGEAAGWYWSSVREAYGPWSQRFIYRKIKNQFRKLEWQRIPSRARRLDF